MVGLLTYTSRVNGALQAVRCHIEVWMARRKIGVICAAFFLAALAIRCIGINYGYLHGDERVNEAAKVLTGQLKPGQYFYPPLFNYCNAVYLAALYAIGRIIPIWYDAESFRNAYFEMPELFYVTARFSTAVFAAAVSPLLYLIARSFGSSFFSALVCGLLAIFLPIGVYLSHIAKSDVPLATMVVLIIYLIILRYQLKKNYVLDVVIGVALAAAFSFKHSFIFIAAPLVAVNAYFCLTHLRGTLDLRSLVVITGSLVTALAVFNLALIADWREFIVYQQIQARMSARDVAGAFNGAMTWFGLVASTSSGITIAALLAYFALPFLLARSAASNEIKLPILGVWVAISFATIAIIFITGGRQQEGLWIPSFTGMFVLACIAIAFLLDDDDRNFQLIGAVTAVSILALSIFGVVRISKEAIARPLTIDISRLIQKNYRNTKIWTSVHLGVPQMREAQQFEISRNEALGLKYGVFVPPRSVENIIRESAANAIYYINRPGTLHGLAGEDEKSLKGIVRAYAWPLQDAEWKLNYWRAMGIELFVIGHFDYELNHAESPLIRNFSREIVDNCTLVHVLGPRKPLFLELDVSIFNCLPSPSN